MTYGRRLFRCACIVLLLVLPGVGMAQWPECAGTCPAGGTCRFGCTELAVRKAVQSANACTGPVVVVFDRTLCPTCEGEPFKNCCWAPAGSCSSNPTCYVDMRMDNSALSDPTGIASCAGDPPEGRTLCLKGDNITFDGSFSLLLQYAHARSENGSVVMPCGPDPAGPRAVSPITIQGSNTLVSSLGIAYFPEGIRFETGQNNRIQYLDAFRICDDAIDTRSYFEADPLPAKGLPTGEVALSFFEGHTVGDNGFTCQDNSGHPAPCGLDKAIQINSGQIAVVQNQINRIPIPVRVCSLPEAPAGCGRSGANPSRLREHGPHTIASNSTTGLLPGNPQCVYPQSCVNSNAYPFPDFPTFSRLCRRICTGYQIGETGTVTAMSHISVRYCNWGVRVEANARVRMKSNGFRWNHAAALGISHTGAQVMVSDTTFAENACTSALVTGGNAQITLGQLNLGLEDQSSVSRVDLGGGQKTRVSVFDPGFSCATSNQGHPAYTQMCSTGGNRFCRDGARNHRDIDNTQVDGVGASVGIGASVAPSCFGTVGSVTDGSGRVRNRMNSGIVGTRCGTVNLPVGEAVGCALGSCDCARLPPPEGGCMEPVFLGVAVYPVTVVLAPTVGCLVAWLAPPPPGASRGRFLVLTLLLALAMLAGAKGYYYVEQVWSGMGPRVDFSGGYRQPGVFLGLLCLPIFARVILPRTAVGTILDSYVVPVACGIVVFRIGCLFQGCCFGAPTDLPWGIQYPRASPVWHHQVAERTIMGYEPTAQPVHPLHVYFASAVVFAAAVSRIVKSRAAPGLAFLVFIVLAEGSKAYLETLRPAPRHGVDTAQVFHAVTATAAATIIVASCAVRYGWTQRGRGAR